MRKIKFFAFLVCILVLFNALPFVAFAQTQQDIVSEQKAELKKADVPELLSFEQARESGHTLRLHSKEESNTVAQNWRITSVDNGYRIANGSNPTYLLSTYNSSDSVYSMQKTTGSTWELRLIEMPVPLLRQQTESTCSAASGAMVSQFYGCSNVTEDVFKARAVAMYSGQWNFAYAVAGTLNYFLEQNGTDARYTTPYISSFNLSTYTEMVLANIQNGHPLLVQVKIYETTYFPYISNLDYGHYVVVIGAYYDSQSNQYMLIVNDPHDEYCKRYIVPLSAIYSYNVRHTGCVFRVE